MPSKKKLTPIQNRIYRLSVVLRAIIFILYSKGTITESTRDELISMVNGERDDGPSRKPAN